MCLRTLDSSHTTINQKEDYELHLYGFQWGGTDWGLGLGIGPFFGTRYGLGTELGRTWDLGTSVAGCRWKYIMDTILKLTLFQLMS